MNRYNLKYIKINGYIKTFLIISGFTIVTIFSLSGVGLDNHRYNSSIQLVSDGPAGEDTYTLIRKAFGPDSIEAPDIYPLKNHKEVRHIREVHDDIIGYVFAFYIHRDKDWDRDRYPQISDRQRNEIKGYGGSSEILKAKKNETFEIRWKFKINKNMTVSKNFSHFFQLKAVGGEDDAQPILTITGAKKGKKDIIEIRHAPSTNAPDEILDENSWQLVLGQWLDVHCLSTFRDNGSLNIEVKKLDGTVILSADIPELDLWRQGSSFVRPKWGIYRSLVDKENLRKDEEVVYFADFLVSKLK